MNIGEQMKTNKTNKTMKIIVTISIILSILLVGVVVYHYSFPLNSDLENLEEHINEWVNRGEVGEADVQIYDPITINNLMYYPIEVDDKLGYIQLKQGLTNRYKIHHSKGTSSDFISEIISSKGEKYHVLIGRNDNLQIHKVKIDPNEVMIYPNMGTQKPSEFDIYELDIPKKEVFVVFIKVDNGIQEGVVRVSKVLNINGDEITSMS